MSQFLSGSTVLLCLTVFLSRILDVCFGTLRMVSVVRGKSARAMALGFCETFLWFTVAREALQSASGIVVGVSYAAGYATGTLVGTLISKRLRRGKVEIQVVTSSREPGLVEAIRAAGYGVTAIDVNTAHDGKPRYMLMTSVDIQKEHAFRELLNTLDQDAFVIVSETMAAYNGYYPGHSVRK